MLVQKVIRFIFATSIVEKTSLTQNIEDPPRSYFFFKYPRLTISLTLTIAGWTSVFVLGALGWPQDSNLDKDVCFKEYLTKAECMCEALRLDSILAQPANTISNLAYAVGGLLIAWSGDTRRFPSALWWESSNLITHQAYFSYSFPIVLINVSYSSAYMHGGWTRWGGTLDILSIFLLLGWIELFSICKLVLILKGWSIERIAIVTKAHAISIVISTMTLFMIWFSFKVSTTLQNYIVYSFSTIILVEMYCSYLYTKSGERQSQRWISVLALAFFGVGLVFQMLSKGGSSLCNPNQFIQGHAFWHILSAASATTAYFYFLSDKIIGEQNDKNREDNGRSIDVEKTVNSEDDKLPFENEEC